ILQLMLVKGISQNLGEARTHLGLLAITDRLDEQLAERLAFELELAQNVEHLAAERFPSFFELFEECAVDLALARLLGDQIPEVAYLRLTDTMNAAEALLKTIGVPWKVVVHHEMRALEVDAFAGGIRR